MDTRQALLIALPLVVINLIFVVIALVDLSKRKKVLWGKKFIWVVIILFINYFGWISYFIFGRKED